MKMEIVVAIACIVYFIGTLTVKQLKAGPVQSWEGIMSGDRYLNMSCCDKVARWAILGFQGMLRTYSNSRCLDLKEPGFTSFTEIIGNV